MRTRRALSSVVGMVFAIIALSSTFAYITYSMNTINQYNQQVVGQNHQLLDIGKEKLAVTGSTIVNNKFSITVANTGNIPINLTKIWVQNTTVGVTDWTRSYNLTNSVVSPSSTLTNIGQNIPVSALAGKSYHIKLVTGRGNIQEFNANSAASAPLSIQFLAVPNTIPSGFNTTLLMIVTNNGSSTLTNLSPQTPVPSRTNVATATCTLIQNQANPPSYNTLMPGGTAIFKWDLKVKGTTPGQFCMWGAQLVNPYAGNYANVTATVTQISLSSTNFAQTAGILSFNYTTFRWSQGTGWQTGWQIPNSQKTVFKIDVTNNNATAGANFYVSKYTQIVIMPTVIAGNSNLFYIVTTVNNPSVTPPTFTAFTCGGPPLNEYCINIPPLGTSTLYFAATAAGGSSGQSTPGAGQDIAFIVIFGKYAASQNGAGNQYGQNIPFLGLISS